MAGFAVALAAVLLASPFLAGPGQVTVFMGVLLAADLAILFFFARHLLDRLLLAPMDRLVAGTERIVDGDCDHRLPEEGTEEMDRLVQGVNRMAERLIHDRNRLADNVRSLDETNRELVETTDELVRTARLASVGTMASGLAHEVGNPLGALLGYLDVAERRAHDPESLSSTLAHARTEARRIDRIVQSLLAFTRPVPRNGAPPPGIDLNGLVPRVLDLLSTQGVTTRMTVNWDPAPDLPRVEGEPHHLEQVLVNLLINARDALGDREGGTVRISARVGEGPGRMTPRRREDDPREADFTHRRRGEALRSSGARLQEARRVVALQVEDDGPGIAAELRESLFDPFVTGKEPGEGMGLGLAISARMVEELGGRIEAENREEGGARFTLLLPAQRGGEG